MTDIRLECLKVAVASGADASTATAVAKEFVEFVESTSQALKRAPHSSDRQQQSGT